MRAVYSSKKIAAAAVAVFFSTLLIINLDARA